MQTPLFFDYVSAVPALAPLVIEDPGIREARNARRRERYHQTKSKKVRKAAEEAKKAALEKELLELRKKVKLINGSQDKRPVKKRK